MIGSLNLTYGWPESIAAGLALQSTRAKGIVRMVFSLRTDSDTVHLSGSPLAALAGSTVPISCHDHLVISSRPAGTVSPLGRAVPAGRKMKMSAITKSLRLPLDSPTLHAKGTERKWKHCLKAVPWP